ncbi:hypothetical protein BDN71DRAFT_1504781 [Pleurotus eryngii]|uniref:MICOS complex subunit MIC12 n=1 Tax=Pleurotus eryngii TaxID=5323 RepID=A0A9P6A484_PLEER|nr:hypothetical protein BDN71DRAFT_1504781 [Pleurotus eryngii]
MSALIGPISGALVAGGVYYGISNLIHTRTEQQRKELYTLSVRLTETPTFVNAPPSAASRIEHRPSASLIKGKWNDEIDNLVAGLRSLDERAISYGKKLLYNSTTPPKSS